MTLEIPADPSARWSLIKHLLAVRGSNLSEVAKRLRVHPTAIYKAKKHPYPRVERELAKRLGLNVTALFRERYDATGRPLTPERATRTDLTTRAPRGNGKGQAAA